MSYSDSSIVSKSITPMIELIKTLMKLKSTDYWKSIKDSHKWYPIIILILSAKPSTYPIKKSHGQDSFSKKVSALK